MRNGSNTTRIRGFKGQKTDDAGSRIPPEMNLGIDNPPIPLASYERFVFQDSLNNMGFTDRGPVNGYPITLSNPL